jgi:hypothetical protein
LQQLTEFFFEAPRRPIADDLPRELTPIDTERGTLRGIFRKKPRRSIDRSIIDYQHGHPSAHV